MIALIGSICSALVAIPKIGDLVMKIISAVTLWYVQSQNNKVLQAISDAAALASRAVTDDDRYKAAQAWHDALGMPRVTQ